MLGFSGEQYGGGAEAPLPAGTPVQVWMLCGVHHREQQHGETGGGEFLLDKHKSDPSVNYSVVLIGVIFSSESNFCIFSSWIVFMFLCLTRGRDVFASK